MQPVSQMRKKKKERRRGRKRKRAKGEKKAPDMEVFSTTGDCTHELRGERGAVQ